ncbi:hypothetical protein E2C01_051225 [Portunus trituberculatus]|uniref:Uncharacterized protein n=1 Tax=Portunus trituberculatus TaxID=210409 RepID=A0A5B7GJ01_PORTR|nr:hypothetical protein [Portunus trituberculatus]
MARLNAICLRTPRGIWRRGNEAKWKHKPIPARSASSRPSFLHSGGGNHVHEVAIGVVPCVLTRKRKEALPTFGSVCLETPRMLKACVDPWHHGGALNQPKIQLPSSNTVVSCGVALRCSSAEGHHTVTYVPSGHGSRAPLCPPGTASCTPAEPDHDAEILAVQAVTWPNGGPYSETLCSLIATIFEGHRDD